MKNSILTKREKEVFELLILNQTTVEIATKLGISEKTVRNHISNTMQKLSVKGRAQAVVELIRLGIGGQCSFSTTVPGITRGNHFHTRKIERFAVIKGKALIQLRKIDSDQVLDFYLDGSEPAYVDMPIWYTHNIKNIGDEELYTMFWINEPYNPENPDTYFVEV